MAARSSVPFRLIATRKDLQQLAALTTHRTDGLLRPEVSVRALPRSVRMDLGLCVSDAGGTGSGSTPDAIAQGLPSRSLRLLGSVRHSSQVSPVGTPSMRKEDATGRPMGA